MEKIPEEILKMPVCQVGDLDFKINFKPIMNSKFEK
jgi:hypothetical protein